MRIVKFQTEWLNVEYETEQCALDKLASIVDSQISQDWIINCQVDIKYDNNRQFKAEAIVSYRD